MSRSIVGVLSCLVAALGAPAVAAEPEEQPYGEIVLVAGSGDKGYSGDGQRATDARIGDDGDIAVGPDGTLYIADDWGKRVRAVNGDGMIDTVPGTRALRSPENDGPQVNGWQYSPSDRPRAVAVGKDGALYIAGDDGVGRLGPDGTGTRLAAIDATLIDDPEDITVDGGGNVYVSGDGRVVRIDPAGQVTTIAGGGPLDPVDADGKPATEARLSGYYMRIAAGAQGVVYVVAPQDSPQREVSTLHRVDPDGTMHTVAGGGEPGFSGDGGPADKAKLGVTLGGVAVDAEGNVYVHDSGNRLVRVIDTDGVITSIAPPVPAANSGTGALAVGPKGDVFVKISAQVYRLTRNGTKAAASRESRYPSRFPGDEPGTVHTVAGSGKEEESKVESGVISPDHDWRRRVAVGPDGTRYYSDEERHRVMKVAADGTNSVFAGTGGDGFSGDGGTATAAALNAPVGVEVGPDGSVYIADSGNERVRRVDPQGVITTVAGNGTQATRGGTFGEEVALSGDGGPATAASVTPADLAVAADGSMFIAEDDNSRISRVAPDGTISTFAGAGDRWMEDADGHPAAEADFYRPLAVALGPDGRVYLLDDEVETIRPSVRMIDPDGIVRTVAGHSYRNENEAGFGGDGGPATKAELNNPHDIATGPDGTLFIADTYNSRVRAVDPAGTVTTFAGTGQRADSGDGAAAAQAALNEPQTVAVGADGTVHVINAKGDRLRQIAQGAISTTTIPDAAPERDAGTPATRTAVTPQAVAVDHDGTLIVANEYGHLSTVDKDGTLRRWLADRPELGFVRSVAVGPDGSRYIAAGGTVYRVTGDAAPVPVVGGGPVSVAPGDHVEPGQQATVAHFILLADVAVSPAGRLYVATANGVYRLDDDGTLAVMFRAEDKKSVSGIGVDAEERLYVAASGADRVYRVTAEGEYTTIAGTGSSGSYDDDDNGDGDDATDAVVHSPADVAADGSGNVYIGTYDGIRRVDADGTIMTVAASPEVDGAQTAIRSLTFDRHGDLYFVDATGNQVKVLIQPARLTTPFDWTTTIWLAIGALALVAAGWVGLRWHRARTATVETAATEDSSGPDDVAKPESAG